MDVLKVTVEQEHIDAGQVAHLARCPVALALGTPETEVYGDSVCIGTRWWMPEPALRQFIADFDHGRPVRPGEYRLLEWPRDAERPA